MVAHCYDFFSAVLLRFLWCVYFFWRTGKMGAPRGWYSEEERTKPVVLKRIGSQSNIISDHPPTFSKRTSVYQRRSRPNLLKTISAYLPSASLTDGPICMGSAFNPLLTPAVVILGVAYLATISTQTQTSLNPPLCVTKSLWF